MQVKDVGNEIAVEVQDDGPTIESSEIDKIFNLFTQIKEQLRSGEEDWALGLPLAKQLVEMHGGCIWAESGDERGNIFCFTLPKSSIGEELSCAAAKAGGELCLRN